MMTTMKAVAKVTRMTIIITMITMIILTKTKLMMEKIVSSHFLISILKMRMPSR